MCNAYILFYRMLVAGCVGTNPTREKLSLRHTTVMPNIIGLPALLCMMFAPMVELRSNENFTRLTGALCGVGYRKSDGISLFSENDIEIVFDAEISLNDIEVLNKVRYWLNRAVCPVGSSSPPLKEIRTKLRKFTKE